MLRTKCHPLIPNSACQSCGQASSAIASCQECSDSLALCQACIVAQHLHLPFHWIQVWNGKYFVATDLIDLGYVRWLGHQGEPCPETKRGGTSPTEFVVVHTNGIHRCRIHFCSCMDCADLIDQAMDAQLFPGTVNVPNTFFSHSLLRDAHIDVLTSKKSPHDYMRKIDRKTKRKAKVCTATCVRLTCSSDL